MGNFHLLKNCINFYYFFPLKDGRYKPTKAEISEIKESLNEEEVDEGEEEFLDEEEKEIYKLYNLDSYDKDEDPMEDVDDNKRMFFIF